jgi:cytochrome c-type biogenesis protein CcmH/NrfG
MGEGEEALGSEPREWRLHLALARIYQRASPDDATTMKLAREHTDRASEAAPGRIEVLELRAAQYFHEGDVEAALGIIDGYMERTQEQLDENPRIKRRLVEVRRQIEELGEEDQ